MSGVIFKRIRGRIVPIFSKHPVATGAALVTGAAVAASSIRRKASETLRGKGKKGLGSPIANFTADAAIGYGILKGAQKFGGHNVTNSLSAFSNVLKKSVKGF
jgi:hypothetical protein